MSVIAFKEKSQVLADQYGWPLTIAKGYADGETFRKQRREPPIIAMVGIDDYSEAFRAGFFHRPLSDRALSSGPSAQWGELSSFPSAPPTLRMISEE